VTLLACQLTHSFIHLAESEACLPQPQLASS